ncbi:hypothetical protein AVEN_53220-1 [Araneus ventricosus]|uniref:DUF19 domain-containing protein n=1 Tax=Araneus ventricosus TaxID=182803 RepID=A0A4Y2AAV2_ARAVE|nr:hypothetical protein AVEN_53220-1 [Araneus ventricosus]
MERKLSTAVLSFLGLFVTVQGLLLDPENLLKYQECYTYALCHSDGVGVEKIDSCINMLKPEEMDEELQKIANYYNFKTNDIFAVIPKYCKLDDAKKPDAYEAIVKGIADYEKELCTDGSKKDGCTRMTQNVDCFTGYLEQLKQQGKC